MLYQVISKYKLISLHIMVIILGFTGILGKIITLDSIYLVLYRMLIAFIALSLYILYKKKSLRMNWRDFFGIVAVGILVTAHWLCFFHSIKVSNVSVAVVCLATSSLFTSILEPIFLKRKILKYEVFMGLVVILSIVYILGTDIKYIDGYIYGLLASFLGTLFTIFNAKYICKIDAIRITMIEMFTGVIILSLLLLYKQDYLIFTKMINLTDLGYLIILGTICTAGVFVWMTEIMRHISPYSLIMAVNLEPIYSIILALIIFGDSEMMSTSFYIGGSIIISVVFMEGYLKNKQ